MEKKTIFEQLGGTYSQHGDYLLPNLKMPEQPEYNIGVWGQRRRRYLKKNRPILYTNLLTSCKLSEHLADIEEECSELMDSLVKASSVVYQILQLINDTVAEIFKILRVYS